MQRIYDEWNGSLGDRLNSFRVSHSPTVFDRLVLGLGLRLEQAFFWHVRAAPAMAADTACQ